MKKSAILTLLIVLFVTSLCFAEKQEWTDKTYDFSNVKRVTILDPMVANNIRNGIAEREIDEIFKSKINLSNVKIVDAATVILSMNAEFGIDLMELSKTNPSEAKKIIDENSYKYTDILIRSEVGIYGMGMTYSRGFSYNTTYNQNSDIRGSNGMLVGSIQTPVNQIHTVEGGNVDTACASVSFRASDVRTGKDVFLKIDKRERANSRRFDNTVPKDVFIRIVDAFFGDLNGKFKKLKE